MGNKHRWYDVIVAWASGENIQYKLHSENAWKDYFEDNFTDFTLEDVSWRVKPKTITKKYRMALITICKPQKEIIVVDVTDSSIDDPAEYNVVGFIRWVGDAVEVEIDV